MKLSLSLARTLLLLTNQDFIPQSQFSDKKLMEKLVEEGVLLVSSLSKTKKLVRIKSIDYLNSYLANQYNISDLVEYIKVLDNKEAERADFALASGDSKTKSVNVMSGFMVNAYEEFYGLLNDQEILLKPNPGSFIYINDYHNFKIPEDIIIVVIENWENFKYVKSQKNLFPKDQKKLFAWRYQNNALGNWLSNLPNKYLHFGDFDLVGLNIYLNFRNKRTSQNSSYLVPENIELLIEKYGNHELYLKQLNYIKNINFSIYPEISQLADLINKYKKGLEQEILISLSKSLNE